MARRFSQDFSDFETSWLEHKVISSSSTPSQSELTSCKFGTSKTQLFSGAHFRSD
jgi:hypothetical protein